jgi:hypothetical protein
MEGKPDRVVPRLTPAAAGVQILSCTIADTAIRQSLQRCLQTDSSQLGIGRDVVYARGWAHVANAAERQMKIACAWRFENDGMDLRYQSGLAKISHDIAQSPTPDGGRAVGGPIGQENVAGLWDAERPIRCRGDLGETFLYHGTRPEHLLQIIQNGLSKDFSGKGYYGDGVYFAEDAGKTDQYTSPDHSYDARSELHRLLYPRGAEDFPDEGPVYYMLVCKVAMGHVAKHSTPYDHSASVPQEPVDASSGLRLLLPNRKLGQRPTQLVYVPWSKTVHYHSLLVDVPGVRYKEIVNFDSSFVKPAYLVAYTRGKRRVNEV